MYVEKQEKKIVKNEKLFFGIRNNSPFTFLYLQAQNQKIMKHKYFFFLFFFLTSSQLILSQNIVLPSDQEYMQDFFKSTLKVCLVGDEKYDAAIKEAVQNNWTLTRFEFIDYKSAKDKKVLQDKTSSFLMPLSVTRIGSESHFTPNYIATWRMLNDNRWLCILAGGKKSIFDYSDYFFIAYSPFDNFNLESNILQSSYRLGLMIKSMQDAIVVTRDKKIDGASLNLLKKTLAELSSKAGILKTKTLLVNENLFKIKNENGKFSLAEELLKTYAFKYKVVSQQEIEAAIKNMDKESCYFCPVFSGCKDIYVYNLENGELIYGTYQFKGTVVDKGDISDLNKAIDSN